MGLSAVYKPLAGGALVRRLEPTDLTARRLAAKALGLVFTSVDVWVSEEGEPFVLECNPTPSIAF